MSTFRLEYANEWPTEQRVQSQTLLFGHAHRPNSVTLVSNSPLTGFVHLSKGNPWRRIVGVTCHVQLCYVEYRLCLFGLNVEVHANRV